MKPIPRSLLIHSATLNRAASTDIWGKETPGSDVSLNRIRIEPSEKVTTQKNGQELHLFAILFFDVRNSLPRGTVFKEGDTVTFNGVSRKIQTIDPVYGRTLHHYEIGLV